MNIIGISGKIGSGKSTLGEELGDLICAQGMKSRLASFGAEVKREASKRFRFDIILAYSEEGKGQIVFHHDLPGGAMSVRRILQWWGTDVRRKEDPDYWVKKLGQSFDALPETEGKVIIIDDIRLPNEAEFVRERAGFLVRVQPYAGWKPGPYANHKSETALDNYNKWDMVIRPEYGQLGRAAGEVYEAWLLSIKRS